jgi:hypothetical protein
MCSHQTSVRRWLRQAGFALIMAIAILVPLAVAAGERIAVPVWLHPMFPRTPVLCGLEDICVEDIAVQNFCVFPEQFTRSASRYVGLTHAGRDNIFPLMPTVRKSARIEFLFSAQRIMNISNNTHSFSSVVDRDEKAHCAGLKCFGAPWAGPQVSPLKNAVASLGEINRPFQLNALPAKNSELKNSNNNENSRNNIEVFGIFDEFPLIRRLFFAVFSVLGMAEFLQQAENLRCHADRWRVAVGGLRAGAAVAESVPPYLGVAAVIAHMPVRQMPQAVSTQSRVVILASSIAVRRHIPSAWVQDGYNQARYSCG